MRRKEGEDQKSKGSKTVKCTKCDCYIHNVRTCEGGLTKKEKKELKASGAPLVIRHRRVTDQSYVAKAIKQQQRQHEEPMHLSTFHNHPISVLTRILIMIKFV